MAMYPFYHAPTTLDEALALKARYGERARILAGGTDLILELERGTRRAPDGHPPGLIDLTRVPGLAQIRLDGDMVRLGALVTHNQVAVHPVTVAQGFPLARASWEVGSPPLRNRATVVGNVVTASPANDTLPALLVLDATVAVASQRQGERRLPLADFVTGFRQVDLAPDEVVTEIAFPALGPHQAGTFIKLGLRRAQAISVVNVAVVLTFADTDRQGPILEARIALGSVAPTVIRAPDAEAFLAGRLLDERSIAEAARLAAQAARPIDDLRGSAEYRRAMVEVLTARALDQLRQGREREGYPKRPVTLWGRTQGRWPVVEPGEDVPSGATLPAVVNGQAVSLPGGLTLLESLRRRGFVGVKEGCAEGECGACVVHLDGMAVLACLVPAERAAGSQVVTVEGLGDPEHLHPVQRAFVESGGVQCGYCTPGFIMSVAKLLEERPHPTYTEAQEALTGNLCRCTGYRKILDAVFQAAASQPSDPAP